MLSHSLGASASGKEDERVITFDAILTALGTSKVGIKSCSIVHAIKRKSNML